MTLFYICFSAKLHTHSKPTKSLADKIVIGSNLSPGLDRAGSAVVAKELQGPVWRGRIFLPGADSWLADMRLSNI